MTSVLRHCLVISSLLVSVAWSGGSRDGQGLHNYHNRRRAQQQFQQKLQHIHHQRQHQQQQWPLLYSPDQILTTHHHHHRRLNTLPVLLLPTAISGTTSFKRIYATPTSNFRYITSPSKRRLHTPTISNHFFPNRFLTQAQANRLRQMSSHSSSHDDSHSQGRNLHVNIDEKLPPSLYQQHRTKVILNDEPHLDNPVSTPKSPDAGSSPPGFLDPANFKLQDMDLSELQATVDWIDNHVKVKDNDPSAYTGSRVLVLLLREQCFRLQTSGDPDIEVFCQRFNNRFRSMLL